MKDIDYFNEVSNSKEQSKKTIEAYTIALNQYTDYCEASFIELLDEAYKDKRQTLHTTDYD